MPKEIYQGNIAVGEAAVRAGCRFFAGYPITPQNEIPEYLSSRLPEVGGQFVQGESEVASINMIYGAASVGTRALTSTAGPGLSLMAEGISAMCAAELPAVIVDVMRAGSGGGHIMASQCDYLFTAKGLGHGGHRLLVMSPSTVQELADLIYLAFDKADQYRNPVLILTDAVIGQMMEPAVMPEFKKEFPDKSKWIVNGCQDREIRIILNYNFSVNILEDLHKRNASMYEKWQAEEVKVEELLTDDAETVIVAYGICGRIAKSAIQSLRKEGYKVGLIRPITLNPFPYNSLRKLDRRKTRRVLDVELSIPGQMLDDVRLGLAGRIPVEFFAHSGGVMMTPDEITDYIKLLIKKGD